uniref:Glutathione peroxidase 4a n=1 Tax=Mastacembelus armatus TaxID=205130 RepID=A0A7N8Y6K6_9TELE
DRANYSFLFPTPGHGKKKCHLKKDWQRATSIYDFSATDIDGNVVSLEKYRGNVVIITNVASK